MDKSALIRYLTIPAVLLLNALSIGFAGYLFFIATNVYDVAIAIAFLFLSGISTVFNLQAAIAYYSAYSYEQKFKNMKTKFGKLDHYPTVAMVVPNYNEEPKVVKTVIHKLKNIDYDKSKLTFYLVDDSTNRDDVDDLRRFCKTEGVTFIHREDRSGYKAGAMNNFMKYCKEEYVASFDSDEYLIKKSFLRDLLPFFKDKDVAYVQTEKRYQKLNLFADSVNLFNSFFFSFVQPSRASRNTTIFAGSCAIIKTDAIRKIGGFPEYIIEDTFFSFNARLKGYRGVYIPRTYALGRPMGRFTSFARQQWRYNYGGTQFLGHYLNNKKKMTLKTLEHMDYFSLGLGLNYLSLILILFTLLSILMVLINVPFTVVSIRNLIYPQQIISGIEYFSLLALFISFAAPLLVSRIYFGKFKYGVVIFFLNFGLAFIRARAAFAVLLGKAPDFKCTRDGIEKRGMRFITALRNSAAEVTFSSAMLVLGIVTLMANNLVGGAWLLWYSVLYGSTFFFFYKYG